MKTNILSQYAHIIKQGNPITFILGAGISIGLPAGAPSWNSFRDELLVAIVDSLFTRREINNKIRNDLSNYFLGCDTPSDLWVKPEVALDWLHMQFGNKLFKTLEIMNWGYPNDNHYIIANMAHQYPNIRITTCNYDTYIENALQQMNIQYQIYACTTKYRHVNSFQRYIKNFESRTTNQVDILKYHGSICAPYTIKATLSQIGHPIHRDLRRAIKRIMGKRDVLVLGYSGNDYDLLHEIKNNASSATKITWLAHNNSSNVCKNDEIKAISTIAYGDVNQFLKDLHRHVFNKKYILPQKNAINLNLTAASFFKQWADSCDSIMLIYAIGMLCMHLGKTSIADKLMDTIIAMSNATDIIQAQAFNIKGLCYKRKDPSESFKYCAKAELICRRSRNVHPDIYSEILGNMGAMNYEKGKYKDALKLIKKSTYWAKKIDFKKRIAKNYDNMGNVFRAMENLNRSILCHKKAQNIFMELGDLIGMAYSLNNLGLVYADIGNYTKAEKLLTKSLDLKYKHTSSHAALARGNLNLAEVKIQCRKYPESIILLKKALVLATEVTDNITEIRIKYDLAYAYKMTGNKLASTCFRSAEKLARRSTYFGRSSSRMEWIKMIQSCFASA
ncbi:MAG: tetratricopeptide repeat protein [Candidatus Zixiibacteriota bacterium]